MRPSVLMLTTDRQIDRRTLQQADSLENNGWRVTILAMPDDENTQERDPRVQRIDLKPTQVGIKHFYLLFLYRKIRSLLPMNSWLMRLMKQFAWKYFVNQETFYIKLFSHSFSQFSPDVVMAIDLPMLPVAMEIVRQCGAHFVYDSHELYSEQEFSAREKQLWKNVEAKYIKFCDTVITVNPSIATSLEHRYHLSNVNVIYNAISCNHVPVKTQLFHDIFELCASRKILLFQGGLSKGRHLETLIEAMRYLQNPNVDLVILGNGQLLLKLKRLAKTFRVNKRVYFHPAVLQERLLDYTQAADAGLIPYQATCLNNYYCTPNKLFEFIGAGIPLLTSDLPEISRIVKTHELGLLGEMSTAKTFAKLIDDFFSDEAKIIQWKKNVLQVRQQFCWRSEEEKLLKIFKELG
ncbi:MAG: glycosyltransferase family 4 protein [Gammaproteobacteria bacterium]|jgi:glycosyltransferase involved in cell wall biosynthesis|nr:glycosyltransferase family 4 protein [Gammaproteobacteria bacterium]